MDRGDEAELLRYIKENRNPLPLKQIAEEASVDYSTSTISKKLDELSNKKYVHKTENEGVSNFYEILPQGEKFIEEEHPFFKDLEDEDRAGRIRVHYVRGEFQMSNPDMVSEDLKNKAFSLDHKFNQYKSRKLAYAWEHGNLRFRTTPDKVIVYLKNEVQSYDAEKAKSDAVELLLDAKDWIEKNYSIGLESGSLKMGIPTEHIALVREPFSDFLEEQSDVDLKEVIIQNEEGEELFSFDTSKKKPEIEAGYGNKQVGRKKYVERDIIFYKTHVIEWILSNRENWVKFKLLLEEADLDALIQQILDEEQNQDELLEEYMREKSVENDGHWFFDVLKQLLKYVSTTFEVAK